ncbi:MAG: hypothetical protein K5637_08110 [Lachnospiraceae bacterium]|nr:hypothetical protein [Lachnospiraceae bacterium]
MNHYPVTVSGLKFLLDLRIPRTEAYFRSFRSVSAETETGLPGAIAVPMLDESSLREEASRLGGDISYAEYSLLVEPFANLLLSHERFLFHGAAMLWHDKAYLFTGKSRAGKSTQLMNWLKLFPEETEVINGDKPVIERSGIDFIVHPSPWSGKEGLNGTKPAPLGGIIYLEQGKADMISRISAQEAAFPLFLQFLYEPDCAERADLVCGYERSLLEKVPVWKLTNTGTEESALLTRRELLKEGY